MPKTKTVGEVAEGLRKRAVIYLRVSTAKQARTDEGDGYSLPAQQEACLRKAELLDAEVVDTYVDRGDSAKTSDRRNFQAMLHRIQTQRDVDFVICDKIDRFARNRRDDANILFELRMAGAQLVSVKENIDDTPAGQLLHAIMAGIAEFYSRNLGAEALKGMAQKAKVGGTPGRAPVGYLNVRRKLEDGREIRTIEIDPERAGHVQWAFETFAKGDDTITTLTEKLEARGMRALPQARRPQGPIQRSHVAHMLKNRYYLGYVTFKGVEYPGRHQTLVHQLLFDRVQEVLQDHSNGVKRRTHHHYLKGILYCARCGSRMSFMKANGHGGQYEYFYCLGRQSQRTDCKQSFLPVAGVEDAIEAYYATQRLSEDMQRTIAYGLKAEIEYQRKHALPELAYSRRRLEELEKERRRVARGVVDGSVPGDLAVEEYVRIDREREQTQQVLQAAEMIYGRNEVDLALALGSSLLRSMTSTGGGTRRYDVCAISSFSASC